MTPAWTSGVPSCFPVAGVVQGGNAVFNFAGEVGIYQCSGDGDSAKDEQGQQENATQEHPG
jgi:hypothetical protein